MFYFKDKYIPKGGPKDGSKPKSITSPEKNLFVEFYDLTFKLEQHMTSKEFSDPKGDLKIHRQNKEQLKKLLLPFLISQNQLAAVTGRENYD